MTSMPNATIYKPKQAGENITLLVASCAPLKMGTYPEVEVIGTHSTSGQLFAVRIPEKSAVRQFERMSMNYQDAVGKWLTIGRDPNKTDPLKPYWAISLASGPFGTQVPTPTIPVVPRASQTAKTSIQSPPPWEGPLPDDAPAPAVAGSAEAKLQAVFLLHSRCVNYVMTTHGFEDEAAISALTAQVFIEASRRGIVL